MIEPRRLSVEEVTQAMQAVMDGYRLWDHIIAIEAELAEAKSDAGHARFSLQNMNAEMPRYLKLEAEAKRNRLACDNYAKMFNETAKERDSALSRISILEEALRFVLSHQTDPDTAYSKVCREALGEKG